MSSGFEFAVRMCCCCSTWRNYIRFVRGQRGWRSCPDRLTYHKKSGRPQHIIISVPQLQGEAKLSNWMASYRSMANCWQREHIFTKGNGAGEQSNQMPLHHLKRDGPESVTGGSRLKHQQQDDLQTLRPCYWLSKKLAKSHTHRKLKAQWCWKCLELQSEEESASIFTM